MKKMIFTICSLLVVMITGCKKDNDDIEYITVQYSITASSPAEKFVDSDKPRFSFTGTSYTGSYRVQKDTQIRLQCSYGSSQPGQTIRIIVTKNGVTVADKSNTGTVSIQMIP